MMGRRVLPIHSSPREQSAFFGSCKDERIFKDIFAKADGNQCKREGEGL